MDQNVEVGKPVSKIKSIIVILGLSVALFFVIYAMHYTTGPQFRTGLEMFFNPQNPAQKVWNWCPEQPLEVKMTSPHARQKKLNTSDICEVTMEPVPADKANRVLERYLIVQGTKNHRALEADKDLEVFRVEGLIFQSRALSEKLKQ